MKILVIQHKMIGDVLTSTILFEALKKEYPNSKLHYLVQKHTKAVLDGNPFIDKIIISNDSKQAFKQLKQHNYDAVIDPYSKLRSGITAKKLNVKTRIGFTKWYSHFTYTYHIPRERGKIHGVATAISDRLDLLKPLVENISYDYRPKIYLSAEERDDMTTKIKTEGISVEKPLYMVNVLGSSPDKSYPFEGMAKLLDAVIETQDDAQILFNYIPNQLNDAKAIYDACLPKTQERIKFNFYGKSLREFIVLTSFCDALIGNEGGAINMAKALGVPTFAIFSPWISTDDWGINNSETHHDSIHLKEVKPELFKNYNKKKFKQKAALLYDAFSPQLITPKLKTFLKGMTS